MNGWYIASLILSIVSIVICIALFIVPKRKYALIIRFVFDIVTIINSVCLYLYMNDKVLLALVAAGVIGAVRDVIFLFRDKYAWADSYAWLFLFIIASTVFSILGWSSWLTVLPLLGTIVNTYALYLKNYKMMKVVSLFGQVFFILYYAILIPEGDVLIVLNLMVSGALFISAFVGLIGSICHEKKPNTAE